MKATKFSDNKTTKPKVKVLQRQESHSPVIVRRHVDNKRPTKQGDKDRRGEMEDALPPPFTWLEQRGAQREPVRARGNQSELKTG